MPASTNTGKLTSTASLVASFKDYNRPIDLHIPSISQSIIDIIKPFMEASKALTKDAQASSLLSSARVSAEIYYDNHGNSYNGYCQDEKSFKTIAAGLLKDYSLGLSCLVSTDGQDYLAYFKASSGKAYCVDGTGFSGAVSILPTRKTTCQ